MKILFVTWMIYDNRIPQFINNCTGAGIVLKNIAENVGVCCESFMFIGKHPLPAMKLGKINLVDTQNGYDISSDSHLNVMLKQFEKTLDCIKPDIVNVHTIGDFGIKCVEIAQKKGIPVVFTDHLYISKENPIERYNKLISWKNELYSNNSELNIIAVSTGMKNKIVADFPELKNNVTVIKNGTDFKAIYRDSNILEAYRLFGRKVLLCVGTIMVRKNQIQLVRAFQLLSKEIKNRIAIIFCGNDSLDGKLQNAILENKLEKSLVYAGALSSDEMKKYYSICNGLVMPSSAEGLSIAALETIAYGQPVIMFRDSECAEDLNDDKVCVFAEKRTDQSLAKAIERWYFANWDIGYIKKYSEYFSVERMANEYVGYYKRICT